MAEESAYTYDSEHITSPGEMVDMLNKCFHLQDMAEEHMYMVCLTVKMKPIAVFEVSHGLVDRTLISPREIFTRALISGAAMIALAHNHPSGDPTPSGMDTALCSSIVQIAAMMRISMVDFLIIGDQQYYSFKEHGLIEP